MARIAGVDLPKNKRGEIGLPISSELVLLLPSIFFPKLESILIRKFTSGMMMN